MSFQFVGDPTIQELPKGVRAGKEGVRAVYRYRGLYDTLTALVSTVRGVRNSNEVDVQPDDEGPFATMTVVTGETPEGTDPDDEAVLQTTWTRRGNALEKQIYAFPGLSLNACGELRKAIKKWEDLDPDSSDTASDIRDTILVPGDVDGQALARNLFTEYVLGAEAYPLVQHILVRVCVLPANYTLHWPTSNEYKQFTLAQLISWEGLVPNDWPFEIPTEGKWVKQPSECVQQQNGTWIVTTELWHADSWSLLFYPAATDPTP